MKIVITVPSGERMSIEVIMAEFEAGGKRHLLIDGKLYEMNYKEVNVPARKTTLEDTE